MSERRRSYKQGTRAAKSAETRAKVIDATRALFVESSVHQLSVDEIAERAGVGRTTVFQQFESKAGLFAAVEADVSARAGVDGLLRALDTDDALASLTAAFELGAKVWGREREMFQRLFGLAGVDPEMRAVMAEKDEGRRRLVGELTGRLVRGGHLHAGVTARSLSEVLWLLTSFQSFDALMNAMGNRASQKEVASLLLRMVSVFVKSEPAKKAAPTKKRART